VEAITELLYGLAEKYNDKIEVHSAFSARDIWATLLLKSIDVLFLDYHFGNGANGDEALDRTPSDHVPKHIILISGYDDQDVLTIVMAKWYERYRRKFKFQVKPIQPLQMEALYLEFRDVVEDKEKNPTPVPSDKDLIKERKKQRLYSGKKLGICIGVQSYRNLEHLAKTRQDAEDMHNLLATNGYDPDNLLLLLDDDATWQKIDSGLNWLAHEASEEDTVVIYFSGHGVQRIGGFKGGEYLCPVEASLDDNDTLISSVELNSALRSINAGQIVLFLDACRSAGLLDSRIPSIHARAGLSTNEYHQLSQAQNIALFASSGWDEDSHELRNMRNSLFTHFILEGLRSSIIRRDNSIWVNDLFSFVQQHVGAYGLQEPFQKMTGRNFIIMTTEAPK
jgi:hypothetical protein